MGRFDGFRPDFLPDFPDDGTSSKGWLEWVDELLDNIFGGIPTFDDIREFLEDNSWEEWLYRSFLPVSFIRRVMGMLAGKKRKKEDKRG